MFPDAHERESKEGHDIALRRRDKLERHAGLNRRRIAWTDELALLNKLSFTVSVLTLPRPAAVVT